MENNMQNLINPLAEGNKKNVYIFYFFLLMLTFSPVIFFSYAFSDDWSTLFDAITRNGSSFQWDVQSGRPVYAVFRYYGKMLINDISSFSYLRLFNILSLVVLSCFIYNFIDSRKIFDNPVFKIIFPLLICLLPAFQVYASWATCFPFTISVLLAGISYNKCFPHSKQRSSLPEKLASIVVLWVAFAIYQPTAITFLFFFMLDSCIKKESSLTVKKVATCFIILVIGVAGSFIMSKVLPVWLYGESLSRAELTADIGGKMKWFINESLINAVNNYNIQPVKIYSWFSSFAILIGLYTIFVEKTGRWKTFIVITIGIGSYAPNLATKENWAAFRSLVALELIISTLFLIGINSLVSRISKQAFVWPLIALTIMIIAQYNIINGFIIPQRSEIQALAAEITNKIPKNYTGKLMFDLTDPAYNAFTKTQRYDEFGNISLAAPWALKGMAEEIRIMKGFNFKLSNNVIISETNRCIDDCMVIKTSDAMRRSTINY